jgi:glycosyltransferase involved in cell wall biosynthesis
MVSSLRILPDLLAGMGHAVWVLADIIDGGVTDSGVIWSGDGLIKGAEFPLPEFEFDFLVCNRGVGDGYPQIKAKRRVLWTHDLPHNGFIPDPRIMGAFAATVFMSDYAERVWRTFYKTIGRSFTIPNGVDKTRFYPRKKDLNYLIFASAPNRGLKRLPLLFDAIRATTRPEVRMTAFSNLAKMHPNEVGSGEVFEEAYKTVQDSAVILRDPLPQHEFAEEIGTAGLMVLPTDYPEICSNVILQALASGTPVITTGKVGSSGEWLKHEYNAMLTEFQPLDYMVYQVEMVRNAVRVLNDEKKHRQMIENASRTKTLTWEEVAQKWSKMLHRIL